MRTLVDALQRENMTQGIRGTVKAGKKKNPRANATNPAARQSVGQGGRMLRLIGAK